MNQTYNFHFVLVFKTSDKVRKETLILRFFFGHFVSDYIDKFNF